MVFYGVDPLLALSSFKKVFSFSIFGIFVNISNKNTCQLKSGGTLAEISENTTQK
ncbi:hypothetical protein FEDK69T_19920 [Flavobacterium enshiense DK69]|nr:hypothetical protein FEDK69T_19920 [Flavobacterium enshiense DK69]